MSKNKPKSRWGKGATRYSEIDIRDIDRKYKEQHGWHRGARVTKRQPS